jgi:hypothetical protein
MRFLIGVGGLDNGMITPCGGEARYMCNVAQALAYYGHEIDCCGGSGGGPLAPPRWGAQQPIPNINMVNEHSIDPNRHYDAYINLPFDFFDIHRNVKRCYDLKLNVDLVIHIMWSWNSSIEANIASTCACWKAPYNHIVCYPYDVPNEYVAVEAPLRVIPNPFYREYSAISPEKRMGMGWMPKGLFQDEWQKEEPFHEEGAKLLRAMANVSNKLDKTCYFVLTHKDFNTNRAKRYGVPETLASIKNKVIYDGFVLKNELDSVLNKCRMTLRPPHFSGSFLDSFVEGAIPIFFGGEGGGGLGNFFADDVKPLRLGMEQSKMEEVLERVFIDDEFYLSLIGSARKSMERYSYENCYNHILGILKEFSNKQV